MFLIKLALRPWRVAFWSQIFSALAVGTLLILAGFIYWMNQGLKPVISRLQHEQVITAYLDPQSALSDPEHVVDEIRVSMGANPVEIQSVSSQQLMQSLKENYPDLYRELEGLGAEGQSLIPKYISVTGFLADHADDQIKALPGIESVETSRTRNRPMISAFVALSRVSEGLLAGLALAIVTGLLQLARINSALHEESLALLKLWGAGPLTVRAPTLISGTWVGLLGGVVAGLVWAIFSSGFGAHIQMLSPFLKGFTLPAQVAPSLYILIGAVLGLFAGAVGALLPQAQRG